MKKIIMLAGLPGVGKTTLSEKIQTLTEGVTLDLDEIKRRVVDSRSVALEIDPPEVRWTYYQAALDFAFHILENNPTVILDEVFHLHRLRRKIEKICEERKVQVFWIEVRCSYEIVQKRLLEKERVGHLLSTSQCLEMHRRFEHLFEPFTSEKHCAVLFNGKHQCVRINDRDLSLTHFLEML